MIKNSEERERLRDIIKGACSFGWRAYYPLIHISGVDGKTLRETLAELKQEGVLVSKRNTRGYKVWATVEFAESEEKRLIESDPDYRAMRSLEKLLQRHGLPFLEVKERRNSTDPDANCWEIKVKNREDIEEWCTFLGNLSRKK